MAPAARRTGSAGGSGRRECGGSDLRHGHLGGVARRRLDRDGTIGAHEGPVARPEEEVLLDERAEQRFTRLLVQVPQPPRLWLSQAKSGHFQEFALYSPEDVFRWAESIHPMSRPHVSSSASVAGTWLDGRSSASHELGISFHEQLRCQFAPAGDQGIAMGTGAVPAENRRTANGGGARHGMRRPRSVDAWTGV